MNEESYLGKLCDHRLPSRARVLRQALTLLVLPACVGGASLEAEERISWDTPEELMEWVASSDPSRVNFQHLTEGEKSFLRIIPAANAMVGRPNDLGIRIDAIGHLPTVANPRAHQGLRLTIRHTMPLDTYGGIWFHRSHQGEYDESMMAVPRFDPQVAPGDGEWHEITLRMSGSPFVDWDDDIVLVALGPGFPRPSDEEGIDKILEIVRTMSPDAYLDIDRIEFVVVDEEIPQPTVASIKPTRARWGSEVRIDGSGFASPAYRNVVFFQDEELEILGGDPSHLRVRVDPWGSGPFLVLTPGGGRAESPVAFISLLWPSALEKVTGDGQIAIVGSQLQPMVVKVSDLEANGVPDEPVTFSIKSGAGLLSIAETTTNEDGLAATVVTAGDEPGKVEVVAKVNRFEPRVFTATVRPQLP